MTAEPIVVAGTDTGVGKTVFAAALTLAVDGCYWKPVQAGVEGGTDSERVRAMTGLPEDRVLPEAYRLTRPMAPHRAAELDGVAIDWRRLTPPSTERRLIVELAGGLLVPLAPDLLQADVVARWRLPVVLVARTALGTINHSLLSIEALKKRGARLLGVAFVGEPQEHAEAAVASFGGARRLGRLAPIERLEPGALRLAFEEGFRRDDFAAWAVPA